jgi:hypothetical protein
MNRVVRIFLKNGNVQDVTIEVDVLDVQAMRNLCVDAMEAIAVSLRDVRFIRIMSCVSNI